jgi:hypothetical protein
MQISSLKQSAAEFRTQSVHSCSSARSTWYPSRHTLAAETAVAAACAELQPSDASCTAATASSPHAAAGTEAAGGAAAVLTQLAAQ